MTCRLFSYTARQEVTLSHTVLVPDKFGDGLVVSWRQHAY